MSIRISLCVAAVLGWSHIHAGGDSLAFPSCGDVNGDATVDISDGIHILNFLFLGGTPPRCSIEPSGAAGDPCGAASHLAAESAIHGAIAHFQITKARCGGLPTPEEVEACVETARAELDAALELADEQLEARLDLCKELGEHNPVIDPQDFVDAIDNPFLPLVPGTTWVYEKQGDEGTERIQVSVTYRKREILGVECTVVQDTVSIDGELVEDTEDWFAQDRDGNVWYFGERSFNFTDGEISDLAGSWEAGVDGAKPGIAIPADPVPGEAFRQEFFIGEAEDVARALDLDASVEIGLGSFEGVLQTADFTPISPDDLEHKFYAPGVGKVLTVNVASGEREELVEKFAPGELKRVAISIVVERNDEVHVEIVVDAGEDLARVQVFGPEGDLLTEVACVSAEEIGVSEVRIESSDAPLDEIEDAFPEGEYLVVGWGVDGRLFSAEAVVSHPDP
jgi:hypothetical protein